MADTFFLVGQGMHCMTDCQKTVPPGVTINFAVPAGWLSIGGVSTRHLSGELTA